MADTYLENTSQGTPTSTKIGTISVWAKNEYGSGGSIISNFSDSSNRIYFRFNNDGSLYTYGKLAGSGNVTMESIMLLRDPTAWYHLVLAYDTTQATDTNRMKYYVNGVQITDWVTDTYLPQDAVVRFNGEDNLNIGRRYDGTHKDPFDGYMAEFIFIDGTQYAASDFGETDSTTGIWKPILPPSVTYGNNGYRLEFAGTGATADSSGFGADTSGNDNHLTAVNLGTNPSTVDTPSNNFCTLNPVDMGWDVESLTVGGLYLTNGDTSGKSAEQHCCGTLAAKKGKWYWEMKNLANTAMIAIKATEDALTASTSDATILMGEYNNGGEMRYRNASGYTDMTTGVDTFTAGDIIGCALDLDNDRAYFHKNGTWQGDPTPDPASATTGSNNVPIPDDQFIAPMGCDNSSGSAGESKFNFGNPIVTISSNGGDGYADAAGYGKFEYQPPSGFYALCTKNINTYG